MTHWKIKKNPPTGICRIHKCSCKIKARGLCGNHYAQAHKANLLEKYALPSQRSCFKDNTYSRKRRVIDGICCMIENKDRCDRTVSRRGLCTKHSSLFVIHGALEKYANKPLKSNAKAKLN